MSYVHNGAVRRLSLGWNSSVFCVTVWRFLLMTHGIIATFTIACNFDGYKLNSWHYNKQQFYSSHKLAQQQLTKNYKSMAVRSGMLTPACTYAQMDRQPKNIQMKPHLLNGQRHENTLMLILCNEWRNNNRLKSSLKFKQHLVKQESTFWIGKKIKMHTVSVIRIEYNHCDRLKRFQAISSQQNWLADSIRNLVMAWNFRPYPTNIRGFVISL